MDLVPAFSETENLIKVNSTDAKNRAIASLITAVAPAALDLVGNLLGGNSKQLFIDMISILAISW